MGAVCGQNAGKLQPSGQRADRAESAQHSLKMHSEAASPWRKFAGAANAPSRTGELRPAASRAGVPRN